MLFFFFNQFSQPSSLKKEHQVPCELKQAPDRSEPHAGSQAVPASLASSHSSITHTTGRSPAIFANFSAPIALVTTSPAFLSGLLSLRGSYGRLPQVAGTILSQSSTVKPFPQPWTCLDRGFFTVPPCIRLVPKTKKGTSVPPPHSQGHTSAN